MEFSNQFPIHTAPYSGSPTLSPNWDSNLSNQVWQNGQTSDESICRNSLSDDFCVGAEGGRSVVCRCLGVTWGDAEMVSLPQPRPVGWLQGLGAGGPQAEVEEGLTTALLPPPTPPRGQSSCELGETSPFLGNLKKQHLGHKCRILRKTPLSRRHPGKPERRGKHKGTSFTYLPDEWTNVSETPPGDLGREWCRSPSGARSR